MKEPTLRGYKLVLKFYFPWEQKGLGIKFENQEDN